MLPFHGYIVLSSPLGGGFGGRVPPVSLDLDPSGLVALVLNILSLIGSGRVGIVNSIPESVNIVTGPFYRLTLSAGSKRCYIQHLAQAWLLIFF